jgi:hypothetical protein
MYQWGRPTFRAWWPMRARSPPGLRAADIQVIAGADAQGTEVADADGAASGTPDRAPFGSKCVLRRCAPFVLH